MRAKKNTRKCEKLGFTAVCFTLILSLQFFYFRHSTVNLDAKTLRADPAREFSVQRIPNNYLSGGLLYEHSPVALDTFTCRMPVENHATIRVTAGSVGAVLWWPKFCLSPQSGWSNIVRNAFKQQKAVIPKVPTWEPATIKLWDSMIDENTIYIGFGGWVGPTMLLAAYKNAKRVVVFEPDPFCFNDLWANAMLNPSIVSRVLLHRVCVSDDDYTANFRGIGGSSSYEYTKIMASKDEKHPNKLPYWSVRCKRLLPLLKSLQGEKKLKFPYGKETKLFLKIDTEGAELKILPDIFDVLEQFAGEIIIVLSTHAQYEYAGFHEQEIFSNAVSRFEYATEILSFVSGKKTPSKQANLAGYNELILSGFIRGT